MGGADLPSDVDMPSDVVTDVDLELSQPSQPDPVWKSSTQEKPAGYQARTVNQYKGKPVSASSVNQVIGTPDMPYDMRQLLVTMEPNKEVPQEDFAELFAPQA